MTSRKTIEVTVVSKRGRYREIQVPTAMIICPCCEGRSLEMHGCELCGNKNVLEVRDEELLMKYPRLYKGLIRADHAQQADAWEVEGERRLFGSQGL